VQLRGDLIMDRNLPDILNGHDLSGWKTKRRTEVLNLIREYLFGGIPDEESIKIDFRVADERCDNTTMEGQTIRKTVEVIAKRNGLEFVFTFVLFIPKRAEAPVPAIIMIANRGISNADPARHFLSGFWPAEMIVSKGYATAVFLTQSVAPDYDEGFTTGFHRLFPELVNNRPDNCFGTISVWSWAVNKIYEYLSLDSIINADKIAVVGHSRGGKTALWAGAQNEKIAMVVSSCAGCAGDSLARGATGEKPWQINKRFPYWFNNNYKSFDHNPEMLPFDQHMLLALIAPRPLFISAKTLDSWADPMGQFNSLKEASKVYELYGIKGLADEHFPKPDLPISGTRLTFSYRTGEHDLDYEDWNRILDFADINL